MNDRLNLGIPLCVVHKYVFIRVCQPNAHVVFAPVQCALVSQCAHLIVGLICGLVAGIIVIDADDER